MPGFGTILLAEATGSTTTSTTRYQFTQWTSLTEWWQAPLVVLVALLVVALVVYMYRRDSVELRPGVGVFLAALRVAAFAGLLLAFLDLQKWSEQTELQNSRVAVVVDTSISMGLSDVDPASGTPAPATANPLAPAHAPPTRLGQVVAEFTDGNLLDTLRRTHDVSVWRFDQDVSRLALLPKTVSVVSQVDDDAAADAARQARLVWLRRAIDGGLILFGVAVLGLMLRRLLRRRGSFGWVLGIGAAAGAVTAIAALATLNLSNPTENLLVLAGWREAATTPEHPPASAPAAPQAAPEQKVDWATLLRPRGTETRLGEALRQLVSEQRAQPISGIVLVTDGQQNAGLDPVAAIEAAKQAHIPVYCVGMGSDRRPTSVRIDEFAAPLRAYPGDSFAITADLEAQGLAGKTAVVELAWRPAGKAKQPVAAWNIEGQQPFTLPTDGHKERVSFDVSGIKDPGRRTFQLRVKLPGQREVAPDNQDQVREADVEIVDRKNRVLLIAGGPTRDYQFLRNMLRRDRDTVVDVLLQTAENGASQDANQILDHFPATMQELSQYDTIVAFDPDWEKLDYDPAVSLQRIDLLEKWVAEEAGGLVLVAGPVNMDEWVPDPKLTKLRALFPVQFNRLMVAVKEAHFGGDEPGAVQFTREGREAEFLWLDSTAAASQHVWDGFKGVYGFYEVNGKKPGATVYARYADPQLSGGAGANTYSSTTNIHSEELPIYMAGQLYGSGRVFYLGSGEMWRLRALDPEASYFDQFYTKLLRYVSQGRLLRGSRRGNLSIERDSYLLGSTVDIEARLTDPQHQPLSAAKVVATVTPQGGAPLLVPLLADPNRKGMFHGQFTALQPGLHRIELPIPDSQEDPLSRRIMVKIPDLEKDNPRRNDALLGEIAARTGGRYYVGLPAALGAEGVPPLTGQLKDRSRITPKTGDRDPHWQQLWMTWLLCGICGLLCLEWLVRRLSRLA